MRKFSVAIVLSMLPVLASQAKATQIIASPTGITTTNPTITFEEHTFPLGTAITTQYAGNGVTFSPALYYEDQNFGTLSGHDLKSSAVGIPVPGPFTLSFSTYTTAAVFTIGADAFPYTFTALLNGVVVDTFDVASVGYMGNDHYGFANEHFDSITITPTGSDRYFLIDNLQLVAPEPSSLVFLGTGLLGLVGVAKRRLA